MWAGANDVDRVQDPELDELGVSERLDPPVVDDRHQGVEPAPDDGHPVDQSLSASSAGATTAMSRSRRASLPR